MAKKLARIYLDIYRAAIDFKHSYRVKRVVGTMRYLPGDTLTNADVAQLMKMNSTYEVIIDEAK